MHLFIYLYLYLFTFYLFIYMYLPLKVCASFTSFASLCRPDNSNGCVFPIAKFYLHLSAANRLFTYKNDSKHLSTACQTRTGPDYLKYLKYILSRFGPNQKLIIKRFFIHGDPFIDRCYAYKSFLPEKLIRGPWLRGLKAMDTISNYSK